MIQWNGIGRRIRETREKNGVTQQEMADALSVKRETVNQWESESRRIKDKDLCRIAPYLGVTADYLLGLTEIKSRDPQIQNVCDYTGLSEQAVSTLNMVKSGRCPFDSHTVELFLETQDGLSVFGHSKRIFDLYIQSSRELAHYSEKIRAAEGDPAGLLKLNNLLEGKQSDSLASLRNKWSVALFDFWRVCLALFSDVEKQLLETIDAREEEIHAAIDTWIEKGAGDNGEGHAQG